MKFTIIIDSREQRPFFLDKVGDPGFSDLGKIEFDGLATGDYSISGMESPAQPHSICIERKSLPDLFQSTGRNRARFVKEFKRMSDFDYAALVIEADYLAFFKHPPPLSQMSPKAVYRTVLALCQRYDVHCFPCPGRWFAEKTAYIIMQRFWLDRQPGGFAFQKKQDHIKGE